MPGGARGAGPGGYELLGVGAGPREPSVRHGQGVGVLVRVPVPAAMLGSVSGTMPSENKLRFLELNHGDWSYNLQVLHFEKFRDVKYFI